MLSDAQTIFGSIFGNYLKQGSTLALFSFIGLFTLFACFIGFRHRVLSRKAVTNSLASIAVLAINLLLIPLVYYGAEGIRAIYAVLSIPTLPRSAWDGVPWVVIAIVGVVSTDFADYWAHRLLHTKIGWPIHAVHHSDSHVNGFTTLRVHALELVVMKGCYIVLLSWIAVPSELIASIFIFTAMHNAYVHMEVDIDHGPLNWLIASPRFHRWHHADFPEAYGKNLANIMPIWDMMFGTYYPAGRCDKEMGALRDGVPDTDPVQLTLLPFALWTRQCRAWLAGRFSRSEARLP